MTPAQHAIYLTFFFALGACVGSFLNVVVWRIPNNMSLIRPGSHCPACKTRLAWYDNVPIFGWLMLRGKCRYCGVKISARYPLIELITALLFAGYYAAFFLLHVSPCARVPGGLHPITLEPVARNEFMAHVSRDLPMYLLYMYMVGTLLAVSLIDAERYWIPLRTTWLLAVVGMFAHAVLDRPGLPGAVSVSAAGIGGAVAAGSGLGLLLSILLLQLGKIPVSFAEGEPELEIDQVQESGMPKPPAYSVADIRREIGKEMLFLLPPMSGAVIAVALVLMSETSGDAWRKLLAENHWLTGLLGSVLGAMIGALLVWLARILGTLALGRVSMGLGDVHLMFGVGAVLGAGPVAVAFFLAPFSALVLGLWMLITRKRHEMPFGPYLSLASCAVLLCYCPIADYLRPGVEGMAEVLSRMVRG